MLNNTKLEWLLKCKLDFSESGGPHCKFKLFENAREIAIPTFLVVPRHSRDLSRTVLKNNASALGLNSSRLEKSANCHISAHCIYLCLAAKVMGVGLRKFVEDQVTQQHVPAHVNGTALAVLRLAERHPPEWNKEAISAVKAAEDTYISDVRRCEAVIPALATWDQLVANGCSTEN